LGQAFFKKRGKNFNCWFFDKSKFACGQYRFGFSVLKRIIARGDTL